MLAEIKKAMGITVTAYDSELADLALAAVEDLRTVGIPVRGVSFTTTSGTVTDTSTLTNPLLRRAIIIYCRVNFGSPEDYDRLLAAYEGLKSKLIMTSGYGMELTADD